MTEFWEINPNNTIIFDYMSRCNMNSIDIFFVGSLELQLFKKLK